MPVCKYYFFVEYFSIDENDLLTNESFIQTSTLLVCNELNISFYSKINSFQSNIDLQLYIQRNHIWSKQWQFTYENLQWHLHQLNLPLTNAHEDIQVRFSLEMMTIDFVYPSYALYQQYIQPNKSQ